MSHQEVLPADALPYPPGPPQRRSLVGLISLMTGGDRLLRFGNLLREYGDIALARLGTRLNYFVSNPDLAQECLVSRHRDFHKGSVYFLLRLVLGDGLLTSEGKTHLRQRRMMQPAFHRDRIHGYGHAMIEFSLKARNAMREGQVSDINRDMMRLTLDIVAKALFGTDVADDAHRVAKCLDMLMEMDVYYAGPYGRFVARFPFPINRKRHGMTRELDDVIYKIIHARRAEGDTGDLLSMLLAARDEEDGSAMTDEEVRNEALTLILAGHETTANALSWTWMLLARHPEVEARFHAELDEVLDGRDPTPDDFPRLVYTRQVLAESMRLYPPVWAVGREAICDTQLGGHFVRKGAQVIVMTYFVHHDPRWYPDPERFDPERFTEEAAAARPKFAYFPFGGGNRRCIGEGFAWMEGVLVLATLGQRWKFRMAEDQPVIPDPRITLRPKGGLKMVPVRR